VKDGDHHIQSAMIMMAVAMLVIPGIDAIAKWMSDSIAAGQVTWSRFLLQTLFMFPLVIGLKGAPFASGVWAHVARGGLLALATLLFFMALRYLPIADAIAIFFIEPLLVTLLAAVFLQERVGWRRLLAITLGFVGALLVIRPNFEQFGWPAALPLGTALAFAIYILLTRRVSQHEDPATMQFYAGIFGFMIMTITLLIGEHMQINVLRVTWPNLAEFGLLLLLGLIATVCHLLVVKAFQRAPVSILAPFQYMEIISATALGLIVFGDFPDALTWLGVAIIVSSGMFVFYRERTLSQHA